MQTESRQAAGSRAYQAAQPGSSAAGSRSQSAVCSLHWHYCHIAMRVLLAAGLALIGNIVIWKSLAILSFGKDWQYCHLVLSAGIMLAANCAG
jgi:hypothetical protein